MLQYFTLLDGKGVEMMRRVREQATGDDGAEETRNT